MNDIEQQMENLALKLSNLELNFDRQEEEYYQSTKVRIYDLVKQVISSPEAKEYWQQGMYSEKEIKAFIEKALFDIGYGISIYSYPDRTTQSIEGLDKWFEQNKKK